MVLANPVVLAHMTSCLCSFAPLVTSSPSFRMLVSIASIDLPCCCCCLKDVRPVFSHPLLFPPDPLLKAYFHCQGLTSPLSLAGTHKTPARITDTEDIRLPLL